MFFSISEINSSYFQFAFSPPFGIDSQLMRYSTAEIEASVLPIKIDEQRYKLRSRTLQ
jgi:hypothetical protein